MMLFDCAARRSSVTARDRHEELQALLGRALVDETFRRDLLNGHRRECAAEYALSADEREAVLGVRASDLQSFAAGLESWLQAASSPTSGRSLVAAA